MSGLVEGIGDAIEGLVDGVQKVWDEVTDSTLGKALLIGGAVWLGGGALGMWQTPFESINGALAGGAQSGGAASTAEAAGAAGGGSASGGGAAAATGAGETAGTAASTVGSPGTATASELAAQGGTMVPGAESIPGTVGAGTAGSAGTAGAASTAQQAGNLAMNPAKDLPSFTPEAAGGGTQAGGGFTSTVGSEAGGMAGVESGVASGVGESTRQGIVTKLMDAAKGAAEWTAEHPMPAAMALSGTTSALQGKAQRERQEALAERRRQNMEIGDIDLFEPTGKQLQFRGNNQPVFNQGIINRNRATG